MKFVALVCSVQELCLSGLEGVAWPQHDSLFP